MTDDRPRIRPEIIAAVEGLSQADRERLLAYLLWRRSPWWWRAWRRVEMAIVTRRRR
jgi:hypothetical protein